MLFWVICFPKPPDKRQDSAPCLAAIDPEVAPDGLVGEGVETATASIDPLSPKEETGRGGPRPVDGRSWPAQ